MSWPAGMIYRMNVCRNVYETFKEANNVATEKNAEWINSNPDKYKMIQFVVKLIEQENDEQH